MHISVITPTHDVTWLGDAWASLQAQTHDDWDWLLLPNGGATIPTAIATSHRVRVLPEDWTTTGNVGGLKRQLCNLASGSVIVELDHDDILTPNCLAEIAAAIADPFQPAFVYSDFVQFWPDHRSHVFGAAQGWEEYPFEHAGRSYMATRAFEPTASSLRQIYWSPNHVRAWTKAAYALVGGHDPELPVCDDHDLICRMYLAQVPFHYISKALYLYRDRADNPEAQNSFRSFHGDGTLEKIHHRNQNRYTWKLAHEWCRRAKLAMYDLGGRIGCPEGYKSVDLLDADVICDVARGLPFESDSVGIFRAADFLEHIPRERVVFVMNELWRCLAPGGWIISRTPSTGGKGAFCDPTHASFWNDLSFRYYTDRRYAAYVPEISCRFEAARVWECYPSDWHKRNELKYVYADLVALKGQRHPGLQLI
jgi:SAM-dependent methyltransferase